jgi:hypothetical protein
LHENGCRWSEDTTEYAAAKGKLECLRYFSNTSLLFIILSALLSPSISIYNFTDMHMKTDVHGTQEFAMSQHNLVIWSV